MDAFFDLVFPVFVFVFLMLLAVFLTMIDDGIDEIGTRIYFALCWVIFGFVMTADVVLNRGFPLQVALRFGSLVYLAAILGSFFRPALVFKVFVFDFDGIGFNYETLRVVVSVAAVTYVFIFHNPLIL